MTYNPESKKQGATSDTMIIDRLTVLFGRAKYIFQTEGLIPLLKRGFATLVGYFFQYGTYYPLQYDTLKERNEADLMPEIQDFTFKIVISNQQADRLAADGFDFRSRVINARQRLDRGAIAFCIFVDSELAHISWVAMTEEAKKSFTRFPYQVDFSNNEAHIGRAMTGPKYRRTGLMLYVHFKQLQFLREEGITAARAVVAPSNIASQKVCVRLDGKPYAEVRYLKLLWWRSWN